MKQNILKVHPLDNVIVALADLKAGETVTLQGVNYLLVEDIDAKHKFFMADMAAGEEVLMYGTLVGKTQYPVQAGSRMNIDNVKLMLVDNL